MLDRRLARLARTEPARFALVVLLGLLVVLASAAGAFLTGHLVADLLDGQALSDRWQLASGAGVAIVVRLGLVVARDTAAADLGWRLRRRLLQAGFTKVLELGPLDGRADPAAAVPLLADGTSAVQNYVGSYLPHLVVALIAPSALVAYLLTIDPRIGLLTGGSILLVALAGPLWRRALGTRGQRQWEAYRHLAARTLDDLHGMPSLVLLGGTEAERAGYVEDAGRLHAATLANLKTSMGVYAVTAIAIGAGTSLTAGVAALLVASRELSVAGALTVLFVVGECFRPVNELQNQWHSGFQGISAAPAIDKLLRATPTIVGSSKRSGAAPTAPPLIQLLDLHVRYELATSNALNGVDLEIAPGEQLAIVGPSGSGKSTLLAALQRWVDPVQGEVRFDGADLRSLPLDQVRRTVATVSQDVVLLGRTMGQALRLGAPGAQDDELWAALERAAMAEPVARLPQRLDTPVAEASRSLSGGERQRLGIARALLAGAPVLLLDEATSFLDGHAESAVNEALAGLRGTRTVILVAHRLSTAMAADRIALVETGRLLEVGPPHELLHADGGFRAMVRTYGRDR